MWHAELGRLLPDVFSGEHQRGVQLHILRDAVTTWDKKYGQHAWMRQLHGTITNEHEGKLMEVIEQMDGTRVPTTVGLAGQWVTGRVRPRDVSKETIYRAELLAATYQHMGVPKRRPTSWYDPGKFWSGDQIEMAEGFSLGEEIAIR